MLHRKVLIADDDPDIRRLVSYWLQSAGYEVQQAENGDQALAALRRDCPHFLVCDWDMPGLDGIELCRRIREERFPHYIYTVLLTAHNKVTDMILALETGADDLLTKPIASAELLARLRAGARVIELENQLVRLARTDPLTAVPNRWIFFEDFERELARAQRHGLALSCVLCDIDYFKTVNDTQGHIVGDMILKAFAQILASQCRGSDHLCRYGGEEFCMLLTETNEGEAQIWADRVRQMMRSVALPRQGARPITASFGIAQLEAGIALPGELFEHADQALRVAKHTGRDRVVRFSQLRQGADGTANESCRHWLQSFTARQIMNLPSVLLKQDQSLSEAAALFLHNRVDSAPVVDDEGRLVGIVAEKDLIEASARAEGWQAPLCEAMKTNVVSYPEDASALVIFDFLCRVTIHRVIVVNGDRPTGVISRTTLVRRLAQWYAARAGATDAPPQADQQHLVSVADQLGQQVRRLQQEVHRSPLPAVLLERAGAMQSLVDELVISSEGFADAPALPPLNVAETLPGCAAQGSNV